MTLTLTQVSISEVTLTSSPVSTGMGDCLGITSGGSEGEGINAAMAHIRDVNETSPVVAKAIAAKRTKSVVTTSPCRIRTDTKMINVM